MRAIDADAFADWVDRTVPADTPELLISKSMVMAGLKTKSVTPTIDICKGHPDVPDKTFANAMQALERNYQKALNNPQVHTPIAWALYHTWRQIDTEENRKRRKKDEHDA